MLTSMLRCHFNLKNIFSAMTIYVTSCSLTAPASTSWVTRVLFVATPLLQIGTLLQIGSTHVLFVATTVYSVCGHSYNRCLQQ